MYKFSLLNDNIFNICDGYRIFHVDIIFLSDQILLEIIFISLSDLCFYFRFFTEIKFVRCILPSEIG